MSRTRSRIGLGALAGLVALLSVGCTPTGATTPPSSTQDNVTTTSSGTAAPASSATASASATAAASGSAGGAAHLVVLADGVNSGVGLWTLDEASKWVALGATPGATALGRTADGVVIATGHDVDLRPGSNLSDAGTVRSLKWSGTEPTAPIVTLDASPAGKLAFATADEVSLDYALAASDGTVTALAPAPTQSFTPQVAWLDEARLLVLATDNMQVSRLAVVDTAGHTITSAQAMSGVRVFGLSADRQTVAAATEHAIYVGAVATLMGQAPPSAAVTLDELQVVWALTLDSAGSRMFMLSGTLGEDGTVGSIHELGYARQASAWIKVVDSAVPFTRGIGQVWLS
jgi:hypothetical protein